MKTLLNVYEVKSRVDCHESILFSSRKRAKRFIEEFNADEHIFFAQSVKSDLCIIQRVLF